MLAERHDAIRSAAAPARVDIFFFYADIRIALMPLRWYAAFIDFAFAAWFWLMPPLPRRHWFLSLLRFLWAPLLFAAAMPSHCCRYADVICWYAAAFTFRFSALPMTMPPADYAAATPPVDTPCRFALRCFRLRRQLPLLTLLLRWRHLFRGHCFHALMIAADADFTPYELMPHCCRYFSPAVMPLLMLLMPLSLMLIIAGLRQLMLPPLIFSSPAIRQPYASITPLMLLRHAFHAAAAMLPILAPLFQRRDAPYRRRQLSLADGFRWYFRHFRHEADADAFAPIAADAAGAMLLIAVIDTLIITPHAALWYQDCYACRDARRYGGAASVDAADTLMLSILIGCCWYYIRCFDYAIFSYARWYAAAMMPCWCCFSYAWLIRWCQLTVIDAAIAAAAGYAVPRFSLPCLRRIDGMAMPCRWCQAMMLPDIYARWRVIFRHAAALCMPMICAFYAADAATFWCCRRALMLGAAFAMARRHALDARYFRAAPADLRALCYAFAPSHATMICAMMMPPWWGLNIIALPWLLIFADTLRRWFTTMPPYAIFAMPPIRHYYLIRFSHDAAWLLMAIAMPADADDGLRWCCAAERHWCICRRCHFFYCCWDESAMPLFSPADVIFFDISLLFLSPFSDADRIFIIAADAADADDIDAYFLAACHYAMLIYYAIYWYCHYAITRWLLLILLLLLHCHPCCHYYAIFAALRRLFDGHFRLFSCWFLYFRRLRAAFFSRFLSHAFRCAADYFFFFTPLILLPLRFSSIFAAMIRRWCLLLPLFFIADTLFARCQLIDYLLMPPLFILRYIDDYFFRLRRYFLWLFIDYWWCRHYSAAMLMSAAADVYFLPLELSLIYCRHDAIDVITFSLYYCLLSDFRRCFLIIFDIFVRRFADIIFAIAAIIDTLRLFSHLIIYFHYFSIFHIAGFLSIFWCLFYFLIILFSLIYLFI